jgi:hypothetical protein
MDRAIPRVKDASLIFTKALPNTNTAVNTVAIHLQSLTSRGGNFSDVELLIEAPALAVGDLADASTMTYSIQTDAAEAFSTPKTIADAIIVQTGAGGAGAAAVAARFRLPSDVEDWVRVVATNSADADASDKSMTVSLVF